MHILYVETGYPRSQGGGGAGTYVQLIGRELVRQGHDVSVVASWHPDCKEIDDDQGVSVYRPPIKAPLHWWIGKLPVLVSGVISIRYLERGWHLYRFLQQLHCQNPIDVAEFSEGGNFWHAWKSSFPYLVHLHGSRYTFLKQSNRPTKPGDWWHRRLELAFIQRASHVVSPSKTLLELVQDEGAIEVPTSIVPYPLDPRLLEKRTVQSSKAPRVLFAARNDPVKGGSILLRAIPQVLERIPNVEFHFFGYQPGNKQNLPANTFIHPFISKDELLEWYQKVDICVVPSLWDNSPNTVYEAMAAGKPVIASAVGGIPELLEHEHTGLLVPPRDDKELACALVRLINDGDGRNRMGRLAQETIQRRCNLSVNVDERLKLYNKVTRQHQMSARSKTPCYAHRSR